MRGQGSRSKLPSSRRSGNRGRAGRSPRRTRYLASRPPPAPPARAMLYLDNEGVTDPRRNLALEEHVVRHRAGGEEVLLFYVNAPSVIIGRNQNTVEEVNAGFVAQRGIQVVRRISGGGAVYHDLGNLNFSVMAPYARERLNRYDEFTRPVIEVLRELGVPAELGGRNDILAAGRKISGNAQFATPSTMVSHGTLLFDSNLDDVTAALNVRLDKIESKGVKSVRSRVVNIAEFLANPITVEELRGRILERIFGSRTPAARLTLTEADRAGVDRLVATRYATWDWNYGQSPPFNLQNARRFPGGLVDLRVNVLEGRIADIRFFGDFMGEGDVADLERRLTGLPFERGAIAGALSVPDDLRYFGDTPPGEILELFNV